MAALRSVSMNTVARAASRNFAVAGSSAGIARPSVAAAPSLAGARHYHAKVIDHYERPRNVRIASCSPSVLASSARAGWKLFLSGKYMEASC
jgi:hypothetical protein